MKKGNYAVGYGKPPESGQFKLGQSGNPNGRSKGSKNLKTVLDNELQAKIPIKEQGKDKKVTKQEAMIKALMLKAMQGDVKAINAVLTMFLKLTMTEAPSEEAIEFSKTDQQILDEFIAQLNSSTISTKKGINQ